MLRGRARKPVLPPVAVPAASIPGVAYQLARSQPITEPKHVPRGEAVVHLAHATRRHRLLERPVNA
jgi:hypothetical protein